MTVAQQVYTLVRHMPVSFIDKVSYVFILLATTADAGQMSGYSNPKDKKKTLFRFGKRKGKSGMNINYLKLNLIFQCIGSSIIQYFILCFTIQCIVSITQQSSIQARNGVWKSTSTSARCFRDRWPRSNKSLWCSSYTQKVIRFLHIKKGERSGKIRWWCQYHSIE